MRETFVEVPKMVSCGPVLKGGSNLFQDGGDRLGTCILSSIPVKSFGVSACYITTITPLSLCPPPKFTHSTVPQDSCGISQAISVPTCPVMSPSVQRPPPSSRFLLGFQIPKSDRGWETGEAGTFLREIAGMPCVPWRPGGGQSGAPLSGRGEQQT